MAQDSKYRMDYRYLYSLALYSYGVATEFIANNPTTRETQERVSELLIPAIEARNFVITREFLEKEVSIRDMDLIASWEGSPSNLAWLMLHEEMSDFFARFALYHWEPEPIFVHHVPKAAGTSVNNLLSAQSLFVAFPQTSFEVMAETHGVMGFPAQVTLFNDALRHDRIYIGGHFNLPDTVRRLRVFGNCQGVSLCRSPLEIMSSALRYIWTRIEDGDQSLAESYGIGDLPGHELRTMAAAMTTSPRVERRVVEVFTDIMTSEHFKSEYDDIYVKYFYNHEIDNRELLREYLDDCGSIFVSLSTEQDEPAVLSALGVPGPVPRANVASFPERKLFQAFGGEERFSQLMSPRVGESLRIWQMLIDRRRSVGG